VTQWQDQFEQSSKNGLFLPQSSCRQRVSVASLKDYSLWYMPHKKEDHRGDQHPSIRDRKEWKQYWRNKGQPWRTEPEIDRTRQEEIAERRAIKPNIHKNVYPFKGILPKLTRADIEWLLATQEDWLASIGQAYKPGHADYYLPLLGADLRKLDLRGLPLKNVNLFKAILKDANLNNACLKEIHLVQANLMNASFRKTHLEEVNFMGAHLEGADFYHAYLDRVDFGWSHLERTLFMGVHIENSDLRGAFFSNETDLRYVTLSGVVRLFGIRWSDVDLSGINWSNLKILGDELLARREKNNQKIKEVNPHLSDYRQATQAYRQLSAALQEQGITTDAAKFAYRAKCMERATYYDELATIDWHDLATKKKTVNSMRKGLWPFITILLSWLFSWFLFLLSGYGYRIRYCLCWYLFFILGFTFAYLIVEPHYFTWWTALGESVNVFHGRGASPNLPQLTHPARFAMLTIIEAWTGLVIEVVLVATLIQRFFGK
jgi:uncharacterized protein YjbI with pentapeptide repeats